MPNTFCLSDNIGVKIGHRRFSWHEIKQELSFKIKLENRLGKNSDRAVATERKQDEDELARYLLFCYNLPNIPKEILQPVHQPQQSDASSGLREWVHKGKTKVS